MGSCVSSFHNNSGSSKLDQISVVPDSSMPPTPIKDKPTNVDPQFVSFNRKSRVSPFNSISSLRSIGGSKDETFYDTQGWLDSDCDDDFHSVNGEFTPSRGSTPVHHDGTPRLSRVFSPQVSRAVFEGKKHMRSASYQSRSSPLARRSFSSTTQANGSFSEEVVGPISVTSSTITPPTKSKKLLDLFKESMRERGDVGLTPFLDLPPKPPTRAPSCLRYVSISDPVDDDHVHVKAETMKIMSSSSSLIHNNPFIYKSPTKLFTSLIKKNDAFSINFPFFHNTHHPFQVGTVRVTRSPGLTLENIKMPSPDDEIPFWESSITTSDVTIEAPLSVDKDSDLMHVIHVTAEMAPIAKVGGLGDVVTGLARACLSRGHTVDIMLPFYECLPKQQMTEFNLICTYDSYHDGKWVQTNAYRAVASGIPVILIEPANQFFKGQRIYGGSYDELEAYLFFCRACLEYMQVTGTQPDIIHVHEWQTSALSLFYWDMYHLLSLKKPRIVLTIHNMEHYGECRKEQFGKSGLDGDVYATTDKAVDDRTIGHNPERLSLLKGGIVYSNAVVTVSPSYLKETLGSGWLSSILIKYRDKYNGVLNGIDTSLWNPATDPFLPAKFDAQSLAGKIICKEYVQRGLGLPIKSVGSGTHVKGKVPLVVCITRLVAQKGLHLIRHAIKHVEELGGQMVVLGRASNGQVEKEFESLATLHNQGSSIRILLIYSEELSHMLYAAADMVLVPSIYEPCGLAQMIGMRYGAVPIVRRTGGLADTVFDMDDKSKHEVSNGFVFEGIDEKSLSSAMDRAFTFYSDKPDEWQKLVMKIMQIDNSWNNAAGKYISIYNSVRSH